MNKAFGAGIRRDEGASLILAMIFVMFVGLVVTALLTFSGTAIVSAGTTASRAQTDYDVDGTMQAAINTIRQSSYDNVPGENCLNGTRTLSYPGGQVVVTCSPKTGSGAAGGLVPVSGSNRPGWGLLALGTDPGDGIRQSGNNTFWVRGGKVQSNAGISVGGNACPASPQPPTAKNCAELYDSSDVVTAAQACSGRVAGTPSATCSTGAAAIDPGDPSQSTAAAYAQPSASGAIARTAPACGSTSAATVNLLPGVYTDVASLNALMSCTSKIILFTPGTYIFDFRNGEPGGPSGSPVWNLSNKSTTIVGGTPNGWDPSATTLPTITMPGSCVSPLSTQSPNSGVQFVFGGDSQWSISSGNVELCGQWSSSKPPITLRGATADDSARSYPGSIVTASSSTSPAFTGSSASLLSSVSASGGGYGTATLGSKQTASLVTTWLPLSPAIPSGARVTGATLTVRQQVSSGSLSSWTATVTGPSGTLPATNLTNSSGWQSDRIPVANTFAAAVSAGTATTGLTVRLDATTANKGSAVPQVDSLSLDVTYVTANGVRAQSSSITGTASCIAAAPYQNTASSCAMLEVNGNQSQLYVQGTVYAPLAAFDLNMPNAAAQVFRSGMIVRTLTVGLPASFSYSQPIVDVPGDQSGPVPLEVYLNAYACPSGSNCSTATPGSPPWQLAGKARVEFLDPSTPAIAGSRGVVVESWQILR
jgi:hypothetical protein